MAPAEPLLPQHLPRAGFVAERDAPIVDGEEVFAGDQEGGNVRRSLRVPPGDMGLGDVAPAVRSHGQEMAVGPAAVDED